MLIGTLDIGFKSRLEIYGTFMRRMQISGRNHFGSHALIVH